MFFSSFKWPSLLFFYQDRSWESNHMTIIFRLIDHEASCPGAAEFYGTQDPLELSRHPVSLYGMYKRWVLLKESNTTCYNSTEIYHLLPDPGDLREMGLNLIRLQVRDWDQRGL